MPQARSGGSGSGSTSGSGSSSGRSTSKRDSGGSSGTRAKSARSGSASSRSTKSTASSRSSASKPAARKSSASSKTASRSKASAAGDDARLEAVAQRLRKLNERIIEAGKDAGETTLTSYEKALKAIATGIEKGPGSSDVDWISNLATAQAKFIRDVTTAWTAAARNVLK